MSGMEEPGRLVVIHGCMFSGKSTALLRKLEEARAAGKRICLAKPKKDDRYSEKEVVTHDGKRMKAMQIESPSELIGFTVAADVIGLDECHFFSEHLVDACVNMVSEGKIVYVAGVDLNHRGMLFPVMERMLQVADADVHCMARCSSCGGDAIHSQRMIQDDSDIVVGGADMYEPRCDSCFERPE